MNITYFLFIAVNVILRETNKNETFNPNIVDSRNKISLVLI
jgi:hypothetical protein